MFLDCHLMPQKDSRYCKFHRDRSLIYLEERLDSDDW